MQHSVLAAKVCGSSTAFRSYKRGILSCDDAAAGCLDHDVTIIGWGVQNCSDSPDKPSGQMHDCQTAGPEDFWIQNSWGTGWGDFGRATIPFGSKCNLKN